MYPFCKGSIGEITQYDTAQQIPQHNLKTRATQGMAYAPKWEVVCGYMC
jgi:hypothetical protein